LNVTHSELMSSSMALTAPAPLEDLGETLSGLRGGRIEDLPAGVNPDS
jgi:hypothetical protein